MTCDVKLEFVPGPTISSCLKIVAGKIDPITASIKNKTKMIRDTRIGVASLLHVNQRFSHLMRFVELFIHLSWSFTWVSEQTGEKNLCIVRKGKFIEHINGFNKKMIKKIINKI